MFTNFVTCVGVYNKEEHAQDNNTSTVSYVLPADKFNGFKVLVPTSKIQVVTDSGERLVVEEDKQQTEVVPNESVLKKDNINAFKFLQNADECKYDEWSETTDSFVYHEKGRKFEVNKKSGKFSCTPTMEKSNIGKLMFRPHKKETVPKLGRNIRIDKTCCYPGKMFVKNSMKLYPSIRNDRSCSSKIILRHLKPEVYHSKTKAEFLIHSTKFGSFIERIPPGKIPSVLNCWEIDIESVIGIYLYYLLSGEILVRREFDAVEFYLLTVNRWLL